MKISTRGRYALRMMLDFAKTQGDGYVSLSEISERQGISKKYLEQIIPLLSRVGYLKTARGYKGGYRLANPPASYKVGDILRQTEGTLAPVACVDACDSNGRGACDNCETCPTYPMWKKLAEVVSKYLDNITLQDVLDGNFNVDQDLFFNDGSGV